MWSANFNSFHFKTILRFKRFVFYPGDISRSASHIETDKISVNLFVLFIYVLETLSKAGIIDLQPMRPPAGPERSNSLAFAWGADLKPPSLFMILRVRFSGVWNSSRKDSKYFFTKYGYWCTDGIEEGIQAGSFRSLKIPKILIVASNLHILKPLLPKKLHCLELIFIGDITIAKRYAYWSNFFGFEAIAYPFQLQLIWFFNENDLVADLFHSARSSRVFASPNSFRDLDSLVSQNRLFKTF